MGELLHLPQWGDVTSKGLLFSDMFEFSSDPFVVVGIDGQIMEVNAAMEKLTGLSRSHLVGAAFMDCFEQGEQVQEVLRRVLLEREVRGCDWRVRHTDGNGIEVTGNATLFRGTSGKVQGSFFVLRDATDSQAYQTQMLFQASYDALTGLPNRRSFRDQVKQAMLKVLTEGGSLAVLFLDLDNFKDINDSLGHVMGDEVLKVVATHLSDTLGEDVTVARMSGDGFAVLIHEIGSEAALKTQMTEILTAVTQSCVIDGHELLVSCSIGGTTYPVNNGNVDTLLRHAEVAMYRAKDAGRNRFELFTPEMDAEIQTRVDISQRLRSALKKSEFVLNYQPKVALSSGRVCGVEALIRWPTAGQGMISPADFIPLAERNGMILPIGEWVLQTACRQAWEWQREMGTRMTMSVNLSARQLRDSDIVQLVIRALEESGLPAELLELELTESILVHDSKRVLRTLEALKEVGVHLSIDDFGTGYSSLSYLKMFPLDYLKLDRCFVTDLTHDAHDRAIVRAIIGMAHSLGMKVIAEGVETASQLDFLMGNYCDEIQGYYFSKPLAAQQLTVLLRSGQRLKF
jgi:diguanylate cyclase (GGDEF)-like protein/PAS domain S-box-containing protein